MENKHKLGLVLSGGGVRGVAHIGVIKALLENDIEPDVVSGSSAGAVVGALYCNGYTPDQMLEFFKLTPLFHVNKFAFLKPGFIDTDKLYIEITGIDVSDDRPEVTELDISKFMLEAMAVNVKYQQDDNSNIYGVTFTAAEE